MYDVGLYVYGSAHESIFQARRPSDGALQSAYWSYVADIAPYHCMEVQRVQQHQNPTSKGRTLWKTENMSYVW